MSKKIVGIVVLTLVATAVVSATNITVKENENASVNAHPVLLSLFDWWSVDQKQTHQDGQGIMVSLSEFAQGFTPTKEKLTAVSLWLFKFGTPPDPVHITVSIRDNLTGSNLTTKTIDTSVVTIDSNATWVLFDFEDIAITPERTYYIVCSSDVSSGPNVYCWLFSNNDTYSRGTPWVKHGVFWNEDNTSDFCFKTHFRKPLDTSIPINNENLMNPSAQVQVNEKETTPRAAAAGDSIVWDNVVSVHGDYGGVTATMVGLTSSIFMADDFRLDAERQVDSIFWQGGYGYCQLAEGQKDYDWDWRVIFWNDNSTAMNPGGEIYNETIPTSEISREFWYNYTNPLVNRTFWIANYSAMLPTPITFQANTTYWITIQGIQETPYPWTYWIRHNSSVGGVKLHEAVIFGPASGFPHWTNLSEWVYDGIPCDMNYQLFGPQYAAGITIKSGLGVSAVVKNIGGSDLTNMNWSITLDGKLIFLGKTKSGVIPSIPVGKSVTVKDFVVGFGKTGIDVTTDFGSVNATGTAFLFFIFGVK